MAEKVRKKEMFGEVEIETIYREARKPAPPKEKGADDGKPLDPMETMGHGFCPPFNQRTYLAEDGITCEQDVPVTLRDGTIIYTDIYRPVGQTGIPALISWSYFGKRPGDGFDEWQILGVPPGTVSRMTKFESPDPAYWCRHGYAVANVDPRGVGHSQGDINMFGTQDGRDGHDFIEWLATQHWCNGKVGMSGNSGVAMTQWRIAAEKPPHLICIAPWEGTGDLYRESLYEGGIPAFGFNDFIVGSLTGPGYVDDNVAMAKEYPFMNA
jgi:predicted acyl esterase